MEQPYEQYGVVVSLEIDPTFCEDSFELGVALKADENDAFEMPIVEVAGNVFFEMLDGILAEDVLRGEVGSNLTECCFELAPI